MLKELLFKNNIPLKLLGCIAFTSKLLHHIVTLSTVILSGQIINHCSQLTIINFHNP